MARPPIPIMVSKPDIKRVAFNLLRFADDILLSGKERSAERSGATVKDLDAAGQKDVRPQGFDFGGLWRRYTV